MKQFPMTKAASIDGLPLIGIWPLELPWSLVLGHWSFHQSFLTIFVHGNGRHVGRLPLPVLRFSLTN
jgi:hypothetical protein